MHGTPVCLLAFELEECKSEFRHLGAFGCFCGCEWRVVDSLFLFLSLSSKHRIIVFLIMVVCVCVSG